MFNKRSPYIIGLIICCLIGIGFTFQNCAQPIDPSLLEDTLDSQPDNNGSGNNDNADITADVSFSFSKNPLTEGSVVNVTANVKTNYSGTQIHEFKKNGQVVGTGSGVLLGNLSVGDAITYSVTLGSKVITRNVLLEIQAGTVTPPVDPPVDPPVTGTLHVTNVASTPALQTYYLNHGDTKTFQVQLDYQAGTPQNVTQFVRYRWQKRTLRPNTTWETFNASNTSLSVDADKGPIAKYYRVQAYDTRDSTNTSEWKTFTLVAKHYKNEMGVKPSLSRTESLMYTNGTVVSACENPYFISGYYTKKDLNNISAVRCSLIMKKSDLNSWHSSLSNFVTARFYKSGTAYCNGLQSANNMLLTGIAKTYQNGYAMNYEKGFFYECHNVANNAIFDRSGVIQLITHPIDTSEKFISCPDNQFVIAQTRAGSYHFSDFHCATER